MQEDYDGMIELREDVLYCNRIAVAVVSPTVNATDLWCFEQAIDQFNVGQNAVAAEEDNCTEMKDDAFAEAIREIRTYSKHGLVDEAKLLKTINKLNDEIGKIYE
jgi:hypothetical protein